MSHSADHLLRNQLDLIGNLAWAWAFGDFLCVHGLKGRTFAKSMEKISPA
jgi:hypothetical protein